MKLYCECIYCGNKFESYIYTYTDPEPPKCNKCGDKNVKISKEDSTKQDIFGYDSDKPREDAYIRRKS